MVTLGPLKPFSRKRPLPSVVVAIVVPETATCAAAIGLEDAALITVPDTDVDCADAPAAENSAAAASKVSDCRRRRG